MKGSASCAGRLKVLSDGTRLAAMKLLMKGPKHVGEMGRRLKEALAQLPEKQRLAIVMFTIDEMPQKDVAEALNCSVEAVKWHVFQGRKKLEELLKEHL